MNKRGFTLIELLIVIAVIVILMGIAIAVSGPLMAKAENNACASMIQKILGACEKFKTDFGAYPGELQKQDENTRIRNTSRQKVSATNELFKFLFHFFDLCAALADDNTGFCGMNDDLDSVRSAFDLDI